MNFWGRFFAAFCISLFYRTVKCLKELLGNFSVVTSQNSFYTLCNTPNIPFQTLGHIPLPQYPIPQCTFLTVLTLLTVLFCFFCLFFFSFSFFFQPKRERLLISMATRSEEITNTEKRMNRVEDQVCLSIVRFWVLFFFFYGITHAFNII